MRGCRNEIHISRFKRITVALIGFAIALLIGMIGLTNAKAQRKVQPKKQIAKLENDQ